MKSSRMFSVNHDENDKRYKFCLKEKKVACVPKPALWEIFHCFLIFYLMILTVWLSNSINLFACKTLPRNMMIVSTYLEAFQGYQNDV